MAKNGNPAVSTRDKFETSCLRQVSPYLKLDFVLYRQRNNIHSNHKNATFRDSDSLTLLRLRNVLRRVHALLGSRFSHLHRDVNNVLFPSHRLPHHNRRSFYRSIPGTHDLEHPMLGNRTLRRSVLVDRKIPLQMPCQRLRVWIQDHWKFDKSESDIELYPVSHSLLLS
jgi:hypothetical protein